MGTEALAHAGHASTCVKEAREAALSASEKGFVSSWYARYYSDFYRFVK